MTSCGCFEVICAYVPECNGVMVVNREFLGDTPVGMTFSTLAGSVGGGQQTPGFMGCGKVFLTSRKFLFCRGRPQAAGLDAQGTQGPAGRGPQNAFPGTGRGRTCWTRSPTRPSPPIPSRFAPSWRRSGIRPSRCRNWVPSPMPNRWRKFPRPSPYCRATRQPLVETGSSQRVRPSEPTWPECARPRAQQAPTRPVRQLVPRPNCLRTLLRPGTGALRSNRSKQMALAEFKRALDAASPEDILRGVMEALGRKPLGVAAPPAPLPAIAVKPSVPSAPAPAPAAAVGNSRANRPGAASRQSRPSPRARNVARCRSARSSWAPCARKAARAGALTASAAPPPCRSISGKAKCPTARWSRWRCSTWSARNIRACCARFTATCSSIRRRWPRSAWRSTAPI